MKPARLAAALALLAAHLLPLVAHARQDEIVVSDLTASYEFGRQITFSLTAQSPAVIERATLFVETGADQRVWVAEAQFPPGPRVTAQVTRDLTQQPLRPFSSLSFWWRVQAASGAQVTTERAALLYADNRFEWQTITRGPIAVHWTAGGLAFGQAAADAGALALPRISSGLGAPQPARVDVYIYESVAALQAGLELNGREWVGGHADPDLGVVLLAVPPGPDAVLGFERDLPHELAHVLIYELTQPNYAAVPFWLNEGLAVLHETQPNPAYRLSLERAQREEALLAIDSLCGAFPLDTAQATLAYAQSRSLVSYIRDRWGSAGVSRLLAAYADGATCAGGVQRALGISLIGLETDWRRDMLQANPLRDLALQFGPWLLLLSLPALALAGLLFLPRRPAGP